MDKFENEENVGFYYESSQESDSDSDWLPSSPESEVSSEDSYTSASEESEQENI